MSKMQDPRADRIGRGLAAMMEALGRWSVAEARHPDGPVTSADLMYVVGCLAGECINKFNDDGASHGNRDRHFMLMLKTAAEYYGGEIVELPKHFKIGEAAG